MRLAFALLAVCLVLSGCSGGGSSAPTATSSSSSMTSAAPPPVPTSDTLHFLAAPDAAPVLPSGSAEATTPVTVANFGGPGGGGTAPQGARWTYVVRSHTNVTGGEVHLWINIKETMFDNPGTPAQPQCTWHLVVALGSDNDPVSSCINEPAGPISAATKELVYPLVLDAPREMEANETITVHLTRTAFSLSAQNAVDALSGSTDHDSRIVLKGLHEPAPVPK